MRIDRQVRTHHFVVTATVYEDGSIGWFVDDDTLMARFSEGVIYDEKNEEWLSRGEISEEVSDLDIALAKSLADTLGGTRNHLMMKDDYLND